MLVRVLDLVASAAMISKIFVSSMVGKLDSGPSCHRFARQLSEEKIDNATEVA